MSDRERPTTMSRDENPPENDEDAPVGDLWPTFEPSPDFIDRVMAARAREVAAAPALVSGRRVRWQRWAIAAGGVLAAAVVVLALWRRPFAGTVPREVAATTRTTVDIGGRARAVMEAGGALAYAVEGSGRTQVTQRSGSVFYRVDRGGPFVVVTPVGQVRVKGTCFRIAAAAAPAHALLVTVFEGEVELVNPHGALGVAAGETALLGPEAPPQATAARAELPTPASRPELAPEAAPRPASVAPATARGARPERLERSPSLPESPIDWGAPLPSPTLGQHAASPLAPPPPAVGEDVTIRLRLADAAGNAAEVPRDDDVVATGDAVLAAYAHELHEAIRPHWRPLEAARRARDESPAGVGSGGKTVMRARVNARGLLLRSDVEQASHAELLDDAAKAALERAAPLPPPPRELLDSAGEVGLRLEFDLDLSVVDFMARVGREVGGRWTPPAVFQRFARPGQVTVVRVLVTPAGVVAETTLLVSSGIGHLDASALATVKTGTRLPSPPRALGEASGLVALRIVFVPDVTGRGSVRVERDRAAER
jgi:periplasmic protein TonB